LFAPQSVFNPEFFRIGVGTLAVFMAAGLADIG
jgi:hypothetical protein